MGLRSTIARAIAAGAAVLTTLGVAVPAASAADRYALVHGCYALQAPSGKYVARDALGYHANARTVGSATPFRMQATDLGRYLLYGPDGRMPSAEILGIVGATTTPGIAADWTVVDAGATAFTLTSHKTGRALVVGFLGRLGQAAPSSASRFTFVPAAGCATFPEIEVNATGTPLRGKGVDKPVKGFIDDHVHLGAFDFLGGRFHCGRPWSPYGVTVALKDCDDHFPDHQLALAENLLSGSGAISTDGWPTFAGWPRWDSLTHEGTYWKWIERAWRGGLRIMVNDLVENRALCEIYWFKRTPCDEMASARNQVQDMHDLQDYIDAQNGGPGKGWFRLVTSPRQAREVINDGKLAVVLGMETSEVFGCGQFLNRPNCDAAQIDRELDEFHALGVQSVFPVHKFDNALGGTRYDSGTTGLLVNVGQLYASGQFWSPEHCDVEDHDNEPTNLLGDQAGALYDVLKPYLLPGTLPVYPPGPLCNPKGLTALGEHLIRQMMARGMIVEVDHFSARARRQALDIIEQAGYPGVISSHSWSDRGSLKRVLRTGGMVGPYAGASTSFVADWRVAREDRDPRYTFGVGYGSDWNGLGAQGPPRPDAASNPVTYPFRSFDGGTTFQQQTSGTRTYDINKDGVAHYGLYPDWIEDVRRVGGQQAYDDLVNGAEAYLQMWERTRAAAGT